ncbi:MAG: hypothetical protein WC829_00395 [Hyphomicrobium sp.]|jgi:uncharacterized protein (DUF2252 family)
MDTDIVRSTRAYETWLASQARVVSADLRLKHLRMAENPSEFLRATFYRWLQRWSALPASLVGAPALIAVGDLCPWRGGPRRTARCARCCRPA